MKKLLVSDTLHKKIFRSNVSGYQVGKDIAQTNLAIYKIISQKIQ